jgi:hypothetical protein
LSITLIHLIYSGQVDAADKTKGAHATNLSILSQAIQAFQQDLELMGNQI